MEPNQRKLLTVVTEAVLESSITEALDELGVGGYTIVNARGRGSRGVRDAGWSTSSNIRIEVVCDASLTCATVGFESGGATTVGKRALNVLSLRQNDQFPDCDMGGLR